MKKSFPFEKCDETFTNENELKVHTGEVHEENFSIQNIFHVHHAEDIIEDVMEFDPKVWDVLLSGKEEKDLTEAEEKEILKFHRYFAHRSGSKLWDNLFHPAGKYKGKKRLVLQFLAQSWLTKGQRCE